MYSLVIIDDESTIRTGLQQYFPWHEVGFEVIAAFESAADALSSGRLKHTNVLLTDICMPDLSGIDLIRSLREERPDMPIIVLSGFPDFEYAQEVMRYGVRHYLLKPTNFMQLREALLAVAAELDYKAIDNGSEHTHIIPAMAADDLIIDRVRQHIKQNLADSSLESVANRLKMNPQYLSTYYHGQTGERFSDYLTRQRMEEAAKLLCESDTLIGEIGGIVGYASAYGFTRSFKNHFGVLPKDYRRMHASNF